MITLADKINFETLPSNIFSNELRNFLIPMKKFGVSLLFYQKIYPDTSVSVLCSEPGLYMDYVMHKFYKRAFCDSIEKYTTCRIFWEDIGFPEWSQLLKKKYYCPSGILMLNKHKNYCDFFFFGFSSSRSTVRILCLNDLHILEQFIDDFKNIAESPIREAYKQRIIYKNPKDTTILVKRKLLNKRIHICKPLVQYTNILNLSRREKQCLEYIALGYSAKRIAKEISLSHRTVEKHIEHIKYKMNCKKQTELISLISRSHFHNSINSNLWEDNDDY